MRPLIPERMAHPQDFNLLIHVSKTTVTGPFFLFPNMSCALNKHNKMGDLTVAACTHACTIWS